MVGQKTIPSRKHRLIVATLTRSLRDETSLTLRLIPPIHAQTRYLTAGEGSRTVAA
jgi:hypothetical protein